MAPSTAHANIPIECRQVKQVLRFKPVYGYGWYQGKTVIAIPPTLEIAVDTETEKEIRGSIRMPEALTGRSVILTRRSTSEGGKHWNVVVAMNEPDPITGFATSL